MSIDILVNESYSLRNLWEATLFDEKRNPLEWTTALMVSTNIPKMRFVIEPILAGSSKGYKGWELPDILSIVMRETSEHSLEKYLDEWMTGKSGVFNPKSGAFRVQNSEDFLYRNVKIRTFYYKFTSGEDINVKIHEAIQRGSQDFIIQVSNETKKLTGQEITGTAQKSLQEQVYNIMTQEYVKANPILMVEQKQIIPVVDKLTALASGIANQAVSKIPLSNLTRVVLPPVVIPPPLLRIPIATGAPSPIPHHLKVPINSSSLKFDMQTEIRKLSLNAVQETTEKIAAITGGAACNAKKWKAEEVTTSLVTYTCAIESYDIGTYDYQNGEGVQYTISLPVRDIEVEHKF